MNFIIGDAQVSQTGYPTLFFYIIGGVGIILALMHPYRAFLFSVFCLAARDYHAAVFTRSPLFGAYLNLNDLLLWVGVLALLMENFHRRKKIYVPSVLLMLIGVLFIGHAQSFFALGFIDVVLRRIWSASIFPLMFLVSSNMLNNPSRIKSFYWALFTGATVAALTHVLYVLNMKGVGGASVIQLRTISYLASGGDAVLIGSILLPMAIHPTRKRVLYYAGLVLIGLSYFVLSFTRGIWLVMPGTIFILLVLLKKIKLMFLKAAFRMLFIIIGMLMMLYFFLPGSSIHRAMTERIFETFRNRTNITEAYSTRQSGSNIEIDLWLRSSIIIGTGTTYPLEYEDVDSQSRMSALYHVAYTTYLAHYGLVGFFIYFILLNGLTIKNGMKCFWQYQPQGEVRQVLIIGLASANMNLLGFATSSHFLAATTQIVGLIYGATWAIIRFQSHSGLIKSVSSLRTLPT